MGDFPKNIRDLHQIGSRTREYRVHPGQCPAFARYGLQLAGISLATPQFHFVRRTPGMTQVLVTLAGRGRAWVQGSWRQCHPGSAYLTPPHCPHAYQATGPALWKVAWATYRAERHRSQPPLPVPTEPALIEIDPRPWEHALQGLITEASQSGEPTAIEHWTALLHGYAIRALQGSAPAQLWRLWQAVLADLDRPWTLAALAQRAALAPENLRRICQRETGRSPMRQVTHLRMQHAVSLLASRQKVLTVATAVGYENVFAFSTAFKRHLGRSPREFRAG